MLDRNIDFMDSFGKLEQLCNEIYGEKSGVTSYINDMEENRFQGELFVPNWTEDFKRLKSLRHIRNRITHEGSYRDNMNDPTLCTYDDVDFLESFHGRIINATDPLALLRKNSKKSRSKSKSSPVTISSAPKIDRKTLKKANRILRIIEKIVDLFSKL